MAGSSRRRNSKERSAVVHWDEIESSEEEAGSCRLSTSLDDAIEEDDESTLKDRGNHASTSGYPPLNVRKPRKKNRRLSVSQERTLNMGRKTVLYGQTPKAICRKQLQDMADLNGMGLKEFARYVLSGTTSDNLNFLRQFHTQDQPELVSLFDDVEKCVQPSDNNSNMNESPPDGTNSGTSTFTQQENVDICDPNANAENDSDSVREVVYETEDESFSHLATNYAEIPTMAAGDSNNLITASPLKYKKNSQLHLSANLSQTTSKTVISETEESDSGEDLFSSLDQGTMPSVSHQINRKMQNAADNARITYGVTTNKDGQCQISSSNVFDRLIGRENVEYSLEAGGGNVQRTNNLESMEYNNFLDDLLFDKAPKVKQSDLAHCSGSRKKNENSSGVVIDSLPTLDTATITARGKKRNQSEESRKHTVDHGSGIVRQCSASYNNVLGDLLFGESCSPLQSSSENSGQMMEAKDSRSEHSSVQRRKPSSASEGSSVSFVDVSHNTPPERVTSSSCTANASHSNTKTTEGVSENNNILPSSMELSESLWDTLDGSLEF